MVVIIAQIVTEPVTEELMDKMPPHEEDKKGYQESSQEAPSSHIRKTVKKSQTPDQ